MKRIEILDSTLRDGAQSEKISYSLSDKTAIAILLNKIGINFIETGFDSQNQKDKDLFSEKSLKGMTSLTSFTCTRRKDEKTEESPALKTQAKNVTIFGKASISQVKTVLCCDSDENLQMIYDSIAYLKKNGKFVIFDAEHFFDGYKEDKAYAIETLNSAKIACADVICLCDTNGSTLPQDIQQIVSEIVTLFPKATIGIHCHDDMGLATANTIMAVKGGATHIQGTFIGTGERCGNANLSVIIPNLQLKCGYDIWPKEKLQTLFQTAYAIAEISNINIAHNMPYIGRSAFSHKAGMHADGVIKSSSSFEHIKPQLVGNNRRLLLSELSGKAVVLKKIKQLCPDVDTNKINLQQIVSELKTLEQNGYQYEGAEASFALMVKKSFNVYKPTFNLVQMKCITEEPRIDNVAATATIKITAFEKTVLKVAEGDGPVHAIDKALRLALEGFYPCVKDIILQDYKVRVISSNDGTASKVRVLITSSDDSDTWTTVGVSADIIEASWIALVDSFEHRILKQI